MVACSYGLTIKLCDYETIRLICREVVWLKV